MITILVIILLLMVIGAFPAPYNARYGWGYYPSGVLGTVLIILLVLLLLGAI
jgi:hypothetical protein